jgi:hypothetical protein
LPKPQVQVRQKPGAFMDNLNVETRLPTDWFTDHGIALVE